MSSCDSVMTITGRLPARGDFLADREAVDIRQHVVQDDRIEAVQQLCRRGKARPRQYASSLNIPKRADDPA